MKRANVELKPLEEKDREQFIRDNQWAFKYGAQVAFGEKNKYLDEGDEIISRATIEASIDSPNNKAFRVVSNGKKVGGMIIKIDNETCHNHLEILFVLPGEHSKGIGYGAWMAAEALYPNTKIWETCTPYFEKRNIHFYVNKCGFQIDQFWCEYFQPKHEGENAPDEKSDEGPDEMFRFIKVM